jgi:ribosome-associated translation inhibitor RaiA
MIHTLTARVYLVGSDEHFDEVEVTVSYEKDRDERKIVLDFDYSLPNTSDNYSDHREDIQTAIESAGFKILDDEEINELYVNKLL